MCRRRDLQHVSVGHRNQIRNFLTDFSTAGDGDGACAGFLQGDDTVDGTGVDAAERGTLRVALGGAAAARGGGDTSSFDTSSCLSLGELGSSALLKLDWRRKDCRNDGKDSDEGSELQRGEQRAIVHSG